ncbi:membrane protein DedA, SNARE-associated domain [Pseudoxanthomonas sp. GM95]|uniref:VTT domain-containing protein n=1 Tax=Pseudoxanthomonas sp. GM95 TaxID=1881043 RepID=UPI0008ACE97E|nr:VTT domain-containing protein [Pseudoxanthomonas sp. GM95]SEL93773.1 membrane protein DedA, SNARE-associated domain [Pseudoxanthomonas sp. GM95]
MHYLIELINQYGVLLVFAWVLIEQAGLPIPAFPVLVVAGSLAASGEQSLAMLGAAAVLACVISDMAWYYAGARYGARVLRVMCGLSLTPDGCVAQTESAFDRWGARSLIVAKFIPGFSTVATAMAGATKIPRRAFVAYDALGALLWVAAGLATGWIFSGAVDLVLDTLASLGHWGMLLLAGVLALYLARKAWDRFASRNDRAVVRLSVQELSAMMESGQGVLLLDVRQKKLWEQERILGASAFESIDWDAPSMSAYRNSPVVVYCDCPSEVSAVIAFRKLRSMGFNQVFPLGGGLSAWRQAGFEVEREGALDPAPTV